MAQDDITNTRISTVITFKDVITFVSIAVTITLAWGVFGTRITLLEREVLFATNQITKLETELSDIKRQRDVIETRLRDVEDNIQTLWIKRGNPGDSKH